MGLGGNNPNGFAGALLCFLVLSTISKRVCSLTSLKCIISNKNILPSNLHLAVHSPTKWVRPNNRFFCNTSPLYYSAASTNDDDIIREEQALSRQEKVSIRKMLNRNFITIAAPAFIQLTSEPLASLVDTAYLGRLGPEVLGGAGTFV